MYRFLFWLVPLMTMCPISAIADEDDQQARLQFEQGIKLFEEGDYENAAIAFNRAFELRPSYKILYNVGQVENELKHYAKALIAYSRYLEEGGDELSEERRAEVSKRIEELKVRVGYITVLFSRAGVTVLIDGERQGNTPLEEPLLVDMGTHELSLRDGIKEIYKETVRLAGGQSITLSLDANDRRAGSAAPSVPAADVAPPDSAPEQTAPTQPAADAAADRTDVAQPAPVEAPPKKKRVWTWVALGVGAAAGIGGGVLGGLSMAKEKTIISSCEGRDCPTSEEGEAETAGRMALAADVLYGVAALGGVTALVLFFVEPKRHEKRAVSAAPAVSPTGGGLLIQGSF